MCRKLLLAWPVMVDIWLCVGDLYSTCGDAVATRQVSLLKIHQNLFLVYVDFYNTANHCKLKITKT